MDNEILQRFLSGYKKFIQQRQRMIVLSLYIIGAGAFGVFLRWVQDQLAFNEAGLPDPSAFHVIFPAYILICAVVFRRFVIGFKKKGLAPPEEIEKAFANSGKMYALTRWICGLVTFAGGALLLMTSETDKYALLLRVISITAMLAGVGFPLMMTWAERAEGRRNLLCLLSFFPMFLYAVWLVYCYRANSIEPVVWSYAVEVVTVIIAMVAFFRMAGFAFQAPRPLRAMFDAMLGATLCITSLADGRSVGLQIILLGSALMLVFENWVLTANLMPVTQKPEETGAPASAEDEGEGDGFEHL